MTCLDVVANLRYLKPAEKRPVYYASSAGVADHHDTGVEFEEHQLLIRDARCLQKAPCLDGAGFALHYHAAQVSDFYQLKSQQAEYEQQLRDLVRSLTGANRVTVFDHTIRSDSAAIRGFRATREPAQFIHNDYTRRSATKRLHELLDAEVVQRAERTGWAIINVWRSIRGVVERSPIACCDMRSVRPGDLLAVERRAHDRVGEIEFVTWNSQHRWYYFPNMGESEVLLIKTFDSRHTAVVNRAIHSAFDNPLAHADAAPRESIESRMLVVF